MHIHVLIQRQTVVFNLITRKNEKIGRADKVRYSKEGKIEFTLMILNTIFKYSDKEKYNRNTSYNIH